jgi:hypothetical protein
MDGFAKMIKMKVGGSVDKAVSKMCGGGKPYKKGGEVMDEKQDKAMIKKAFKQHDKAEHEKEEPTEIKLKKGGRSKKEVGTVKKFKDGSAVYGAKKDATDKKEIAAVKKEKPKMLKSGGSTGVSDVEKEKSKPAGDKVATIKVKPTVNKKADAPSKGSVKPAMRASDVEKEKSKPTGDKKADAPNKAATKPNRLKDKVAPDDINGYKEGKKIKKFADGRLTGPMDPYEVERKKRLQANMATLSPDMQRQLMQQMPPSQLQAAGVGAGLGAIGANPQGMQPQPQPAPSMPGQLPPNMGQ